MTENILTIKAVTKSFRTFDGLFKISKTAFNAVDNVSLDIKKGSSLGIVGESGSGKSTLAKIIADIYEPTTGHVMYYDTPIRKLGDGYEKYRKNVQMVFQDPYSSLNPKLTIYNAMKDGVLRHVTSDKAEARRKCAEIMQMVGLEEEHLDRYPHEFSGGQRQRISIARALSLEPEIIIADEPVSALDVSVQAQILNLMKKIKVEKGITFVLISHDLAVVSFLCEEIAVMHKGQMVEFGRTNEIISSPKNQYTEKLLQASH